MDLDAKAGDTSSEASYFEQEPVSGAVLLDQELLHREACSARGNILTGCGDLDGHVLVGGLARGRVVGVSAEEESFGLLVRSPLAFDFGPNSDLTAVYSSDSRLLRGSWSWREHTANHPAVVRP